MLLLCCYFKGAGYHSDSLKKDYKKTCYQACRKATEALLQGGNAVDAVEKAIVGTLLYKHQVGNLLAPSLLLL